MKFVPGLLGACLLLTACSGSPPAAPPTVTVTAPATPSAATADPAVLSWMDGFCSAIHGYRDRTNDEAAPGKPEPGSVAEAQKVLSETLGGIAARTGEVVDKLTALPPGPVPTAEKVRQAFVKKYTTARDHAAEAKKALDSARPGDGASQLPAADAVKRAQQDLDGAYDPIAPMVDSPDLIQAAATVPGCKG
ncbi:hypothetical protein MUY14_27855 [Amycolatopsis sp. FBCC-B4732]|uniref:hypothetical protein n=1 Tax=Amycolatopsis sp. FBCC-B4732 TaxID=3079339 RepID=UPI001FF573F0|nr:hypothetical protein [Amycolatopsis sp. FBCC-B4732]UOX85590.1 hypothetical protein MUY14_27855 [Amycolatopsis sp. FBCC-B4732]